MGIYIIMRIFSFIYTPTLTSLRIAVPVDTSFRNLRRTGTIAWPIISKMNRHTRHLAQPLLLSSLFLSVLLSFGAQSQQEASPTAEPTTAEEAFAQKAKAAAELDKKYLAYVATLPADEQTWERTLQDNLGSFYLPIHQRQKLEGQSNAWDFVRDDPQLPRVLLIGDSVSRGYTQAVRKALDGRANVHRAPANCGPTATGLKKIEVWLGDPQKKWHVIHFNFGIHDRSTPLPDYTERLDQLVERMKKSTAHLIWASTTPIPDMPDGKQTAQSIVDRNNSAAAVMKKHAVAIDDLFTAMTPHLSEYQNPDDVHFNTAGYDFLGKEVAESIEGTLPSK